METILQQLRTRGYDFTPVFDGEFHQISEPIKGWYVASELISGTQKYLRVVVGDWRTGEREVFEDGDIGRGGKKKLGELTHRMQLVESLKRRQLNLDTKREVQGEWERATPLSAPTNYMLRKSWAGGFHGLRHDPGLAETLYVPMRDFDGTIWNIQKIYFSGEKEFMRGGRIDGLFFNFGEIEHEGKVFVTEGLATAMTVHTLTNTPTLCAFNAGNLIKVACELRARYPLNHIIIAGDNDHEKTPNTGQEKAIEAAQAAKADYVLPDFSKIEKAEGLSDFNDLQKRAGDAETRAQLDRRLSEWEPEKIFETSLANGFHHTEIKNGNVVSTPDHVSLRQYFDLKFPYKSLRQSAITWAWNGTHYVKVSDTEIRGFAHRFFQPEPNIKTLAEFLSHIHHTNLVTQEWFKESTHGLINFKNGVFDLKTGDFELGHSKDRGFRYCLPYGYDEHATCPTFDRMIRGITEGDESLEKILLEYFGYALSGDPCFAQKILVLFGEGSNGKSSLIQVMKSLMGHATVSFEPDDMKRDSKKIKLESALLADFEEMPKFSTKEFWETMKSLSSGGDVTVDVKYKDAISFTNRCKFVITCNELPVGTEPTHGYFRRLLLVPLMARFGRDAGDLTEEKEIHTRVIETELPGVFNRVFRAYVEFKNRGYVFTESRVVREQVQNYAMDSNTVAQWCEEVDFEVLPEANDAVFLQLDEMYQKYQAWIETLGMNPVRFIEFARRIKAANPVLKDKTREVRRLVGDYRRRILLGVRYSCPKNLC